VKTAVKRHGGGHKEGTDTPIARTSERATAVEAHGPAMNSGIKSRSEGLYKRILEDALEYCRGARSLLLDH
jgi:hypothetical protein